MELSEPFAKLAPYVAPYTVDTRPTVIAKTVVIQQGTQDEIVLAWSRKLTNVLPNLTEQAIALDVISILDKAMPVAEIAGAVLSGEVSYETLLNALEFLSTALELTTINISESQAKVLLTLYQLQRDGQPLTYDLPALQQQVKQLTQLDLAESELQKLLTDLIKLYCIQRAGDTLVLVEKIVLQQVNS